MQLLKATIPSLSNNYLLLPNGEYSSCWSVDDSNIAFLTP